MATFLAYKYYRKIDEEEPFPLVGILPTSSKTLEKMQKLPLFSSDIFICSYPKSGTTWMQHIVHTLATDGNSPLPHVSDACPFYDVDRTWSENTDEAVLAAPVIEKHAKIHRRIFNTHLRWDMMPKNNKDARYIYMVRRPTDACVSFFHHLIHQSEDDGGFVGDFDSFVKEWTSGRSLFGSWSAHVKSWLGSDGYRLGASDARVLVLSYEELKADLLGGLRQVNAHCRFGLSDARLTELCPRFTFDYMRAHEDQFEPRSVKWVEPQPESLGSSEAKPEKEFHFVRAGRVGDGDAAFASTERRAALKAMVARSFPRGTPERVAKLMP